MTTDRKKEDPVDPGHPFRLMLSAPTVLSAQTCTSKVTGTAVSAFASFDRQIRTALQQNNVKGGALAISYNGRLIYAGDECAGIASDTPVRSDTLMRVASISKAFTAVGVM